MIKRFFGLNTYINAQRTPFRLKNKFLLKVSAPMVYITNHLLKFKPEGFPYRYHTSIAQ